MKICVVTGTRAEYGLLYWLMKEIEKDKSLDLQLIVTGMHLSSEFGLTYKEIEKDFKIARKVEMLLSSDSDAAVAKSMGIAQVLFSDVFSQLKPDLLVVLGDRFELLSACSTALVMRIPIAHIHGGETSEGAFDESIRHSITKMSHIHFTATKEYKKRVLQLGENPKHVFNVGGLGIENIKKLKLLTKLEFEKSIEFKLDIRSVLVTFHPVTLENETAEEQFSELLKAIDELKNTTIIFTKANSDTNGRVINQMIDDYVQQNPLKAIVFTSLGQLRYLSALQYVDCVIGNSSSGLLEVPSFGKPTINIGDRQKGRIKAKSVIDCKPSQDDILTAISKAYSNKFQKKLDDLENPYDKGSSSKRIVKAIKSITLDNLLKKKFYDI